MKQQRNTRQRQLVLDAVRSRQDHPTAEQIYQSVRERDAHVSRGTVYRNLNLLCEKQDIYRVVMADCDRFDLRADPHHHMRCVLCGSVVDVDLPYDAAYDAQLSRETAIGYWATGWWWRASAGLPEAYQLPANFLKDKKRPLTRIPCQGTFFNAVKSHSKLKAIASAIPRSQAAAPPPRPAAISPFPAAPATPCRSPR